MRVGGNLEQIIKTETCWVVMQAESENIHGVGKNSVPESNIRQAAI